MLQTLYIKNYALIDETKVEFNNGLVTITGETGAGKSILLGALSLIVGNRADTTVLRDKDNKCIVEAVFDVAPLQLHDFFKENELDYEELCIIRREILPGGKSRAFVNDSPVQLAILKTLGDMLVDIHSQHETLQLNNESYQVETLDLFSDNQWLLAEFKTLFQQLKKNEQKLADLIDKESRMRAEHEFISFQYNELNEAGLKEGEQEQLEEDLNKGEHSEEIKTITGSVLNEVLENENNLLDRIYAIRQAMQKISGYDSQIHDVSTRLLQLYEELKDISTQLENISSSTDFDPQKKQLIEDRLDVLYTLQKKHRVQTTAQLLILMEQMEKSLEAGSNLDDTLTRLQNQINTDTAQLWKLAATLRKNREQASAKLQKEVVQVLKVLGMPDAQLKLTIVPTTELNKYGADKIKYLFTANKGVDPEELSKVASGGEVSRLMLSIKALTSGKKKQPTIIFDEIDTGVSGNIADKLGLVMQKMGQNQQVIAITHLPQIASKGNLHIRVEKMEVNNKTISILKPLTNTERIQELAVMLSGSAITDEAIKNAKVLLGVQ